MNSSCRVLWAALGLALTALAGASLLPTPAAGQQAVGVVVMPFEVHAPP